MSTDIIDETTFAGLLDSLGGDVEFLGELVEAYLAESPGLFASMRQGIASGDGPTLQRAAHSLKSGSASLGALAFAAQCKELEEMGKAGALEGAETRYEALEAAYGGVVAALEGHAQSARSASA
jgi:HPt (histidine-containing phosphotransfer) domain-containing protein